MKKLNKKGFTLIELIVVIGILAVLAVILIPSISNYIGEAREARNTANARAIYSEVTAAVAMGTNPAPTSPVVKNGVSCSFGIANSAVTGFGCTIASGGDGKFEGAASSYTPWLIWYLNFFRKL